jgi:hypothetical protein
MKVTEEGGNLTKTICALMEGYVKGKFQLNEV